MFARLRTPEGRLLRREIFDYAATAFSAYIYSSTGTPVTACKILTTGSYLDRNLQVSVYCNYHMIKGRKRASVWLERTKCWSRCIYRSYANSTLSNAVAPGRFVLQSAETWKMHRYDALGECVQATLVRIVVSGRLLNRFRN